MVNSGVEDPAPLLGSLLEVGVQRLENTAQYVEHRAVAIPLHTGSVGVYEVKAIKEEMKDDTT